MINVNNILFNSNVMGIYIKYNLGLRVISLVII